MHRFSRRLKPLQQYAEAHTIRVEDFFRIIDAYLWTCAKYLDEPTMTQIEEETNNLFLAEIGQTREWSWREFRAIKEMSDEDLMNVIQKHLS